MCVFRTTHILVHACAFEALDKHLDMYLDIHVNKHLDIYLDLHLNIKSDTHFHMHINTHSHRHLKLAYVLLNAHFYVSD